MALALRIVCYLVELAEITTQLTADRAIMVHSSMEQLAPLTSLAIWEIIAQTVDRVLALFWLEPTALDVQTSTIVSNVDKQIQEPALYANQATILKGIDVRAAPLYVLHA